MGEKQQFELWREELALVIESKVNELHLLGYTKATADQVWECTLYKLRKKKDYTHLHSFVNTILTLGANEFMNCLAVQSYNSNDWFSNDGVLDELIDN